MKSKKNSKIVNAVERVVDGLVKTLEQMKDFTLDQAPDVAKQMVAERKVELTWDAATSGGFMLLCAYLAKTCWDFYAESSKQPAFFYGLGGAICLVAAMVFAGCLIESLKSLSMLRAAPKVFLLQKLKDKISE